MNDSESRGIAPPLVAKAVRLRIFGGLTACFLASISFSFAQQSSKPDVPWLDDVQRAPSKLPEDAPKLVELVHENARLEDWQRRRAELRAWWLEFLGPIQRAQHPPELRLIQEENLDRVVHQRISYESEPGWTTEAYLLKPIDATKPSPAVVVLHSTVQHSIRQPAGVEGKPEKAFGLKLAERGFVALCPRNFLWPTNNKVEANAQTRVFQQRHPNSKGMAKMLLDAMVAVDILADLPEVDSRRIGAVGHSLGAKEVLYLAAFDDRVRVAVSSEGGIGTRFSNWDAPWYLGPTIKHDQFAHEHHELLGLISPRPFLLIGGDSADGDRSWPFIQAALPVYRLYEKQPRIGLLNHRQGHSVPRIAEDRVYQWLETYLR